MPSVRERGAHPYRRPASTSQEQQSRLGTLISYAAAPLKWGASLFLSAEATAEEDEGAPEHTLRPGAARSERPPAGTHSLLEPHG